MSFFNNAMNIVRNTSTSDATLSMLEKLQSQGNIIMATLAEVKSAIATLDEKVATNNALITDLKAKLASVAAASSVDLDAVLAEINKITPTA